MTGRRSTDRGSVVAEFAVALPAIVLVLVLCAGVLTAAVTQVRLQDAAADAARLAARGESFERVAATAAAVSEARAALTRRGDLVCVTVTAPAPPPLASLRASACALDGGR